MNQGFLARLFIEAMLPISLLVAAGGFWRGRYPESRWLPLRAGLNDLILKIFTPALLFAIAARTPLSRELLILPLLITVAIGVSGVLLYGLFFRLRLFGHLSASTRATLMLCGMFGNTFYLGLPILTALFGEPAQKYPAFTDMMASIPLVWSVGVWVLVRLGGQAQGELSLFRLLLKLPLIWAFVLGLLVNVSGFSFPSLYKACQLIGAASVPIMLFVFGLSIPWKKLVPTPAVLTVCLAKLLLAPLAVWGVAALLFGRPGETEVASVIEAAMPTFLTSIVMAERFGGDVEAAALAIGWSQILMWVSLPLVLSLMHLA